MNGARVRPPSARRPGSEDIEQRVDGGRVGLVARERAERLERLAELGDVHRARVALGEVRLEARAVGGGQRAVEVLGDALDQTVLTRLGLDDRGLPTGAQRGRATASFALRVEAS